MFHVEHLYSQTSRIELLGFASDQESVFWIMFFYDVVYVIHTEKSNQNQYAGLNYISDYHLSADMFHVKHPHWWLSNALFIAVMSLLTEIA